MPAAAGDDLGEHDGAERALDVEIDHVDVDVGRGAHRARHREQLRDAEVRAAGEEAAGPHE